MAADNTFDDDALQRNEDDDDLDLLTYNEARVRLAEEVLAQERRLTHFRSLATVGADAASCDAAIAACEQRLQALRDAVRRTQSPAVTQSNAAAFYGWDLAPAGG